MEHYEKYMYYLIIMFNNSHFKCKNLDIVARVVEAIFGFLVDDQTCKQQIIFSRTKHILISDQGYCIV
jgi:hypothetical protein